MSTTIDTDIQNGNCAKCSKPARPGFPLKDCNKCQVLFHANCLNKTSAGNKTFLFYCDGCKQKKQKEKERENDNTSRPNTNTRQSLAHTPQATGISKAVGRVTGLQAPVTAATKAGKAVSGSLANSYKSDVRKSTGSSMASSAPRQGGNSNALLTAKARGQTTSLAAGENQILGLQAAPISTVKSNNNVSNAGISFDNLDCSSIVSLDAFIAALDVRIAGLFDKFISHPARDKDFSSDLCDKMTSLESTVRHQASLLENITLELHELRRTNKELSKEILKLQSTKDNDKTKDIYDNNAFNITSPSLINHFPTTPSHSGLYSSTDESEVVRDGELIINNFITGENIDYQKVAYAVLATLDSTFQPTHITSTRPLPPISPSTGPTTEPRGRFVVALSSPTLVGKVLHAKSRRTRFCTDDLNPSLLGQELLPRVKRCKIFINEALSKEKFRKFCTLKSAAKGLGIKYVWHRGGKFLARVRGGQTAHVFESLSDLQTILNASRNTTSRREGHFSDTTSGNSLAAPAQERADAIN